MRLDGATAVVSGAAGFIGRHLVAALAEAGARVVAVDNAWGRPDRAPQPELSPEAPRPRRHDADLRTAEIAPLVVGADVVFHLAALPGVWPSWARFDEYLSANVSATKRLLDGCVAAGVPRVVVASSSSVYGEGVTGAVAEHRPPRPISPYAVTKLATEQLALAYAARPDAALTAIVLRYFTVYGPGQRPDMLISRAIRAGLDGAPLTIYGDGSHRRDFVYVQDVVQANLLALRAGLESQVINVGSGTTASVDEVLATIGDLIGTRLPVRYCARRAGDVRATHSDIGRARHRLGYQPRIDLRDGLARQIAAASKGMLAPSALPEPTCADS